MDFMVIGDSIGLYRSFFFDITTKHGDFMGFLMVIYGDLMGTYPPENLSCGRWPIWWFAYEKHARIGCHQSIHGDVHDFLIPILGMTRLQPSQKPWFWRPWHLCSSLAGMMIPIHWLGHQYASEGFWGIHIFNENNVEYIYTHIKRIGWKSQALIAKGDAHIRPWC